MTYSSFDNSIYSYFGSSGGFQKCSLGSGSCSWSTLPSRTFSSSALSDGIISDNNGVIYSIINGVANQPIWYYKGVANGGDGSWHVVPNSTSTLTIAAFRTQVIYSDVNHSIYVTNTANGTTNTFSRYSILEGKWYYNISSPYFISESGWATPGSGNYLYFLNSETGNKSIMRYTLSSSYYPSGNFTSSVLDLGQNSFPTKLSWNAATSSSANVSFQLRSSTSTDFSNATWYGPTGTGDYYTNSSGQTINPIHNGSRYFQYQAVLSGDTTNTPTLNDVTINYNYYSTSTPGILVSSAYNTKSDANVLSKIQWDATTPASTTVKFQVGTAPDSTSTPSTPGTFSEFTGPTGTSSYFMSATGSESMPASFTDGANDQWIQYKAFLSTNDTTVTPSLGTTTLTYVVNAPPDFNPSSPVTASENTTDESIAINYSVRDIDTDAIGNKNNYQVTPSFQYSLDGGSSWNSISTSTLDAADYANQSVAVSDYTAHTARWNVKAQIGSAFSTNTKIRVVVNDNEAANNTASSNSSAFTLDTKIPTGTSVKIDATHFPSGTITLSASDDSPGIKMKVGQKSDLSDTPTYEAYNTTKSITLNSATGTVYAQFQDSYGNTTNIISTTLPALGVVPVKIDASYSPSTALITLSSATAVNMKVGKTADLSDVPTWISYSATANLTVNQGDTVYAQFIDVNGNISPIFSATLPKLGTLPIIVDESQTPALVALSMASTSVQMEVSQYSDFHDVGYINYSTTTTLTLSPGLRTVYARFKDANGNVTSIVSATPPTPGAIPIKVDASQSPALVTLSATAATSSFQMEVGLNSDLSGATYQTYNATTTLPISSSNTTAYARFKDPSGNISAIFSAVPPNPPSNYFFQDLSNVSTSEWREFFAWGQSDSSNFQQYNVSRSVNNGPYTHLQTITNKQTNYIVDAGLDPNSTYSYEMSIQDTNGNISFLSTPTRYDKPDGVGGSDLTAPTIDKSSVIVGDINTTGAAISWTSNKFSNSVVYYIATSTYPGDVKTSYVGTIGVPTIVTSHSVKLSGLVPGTQYYFLVESTDASGNIGQSSDSTFAFTTLPGPAITNVRTIEVQNNQAKVAWNTNIPADSTVIYSVNPDLSNPQVVSSLTPFVTSHLVTISNLTPGVQYYYFVKSVDGQNNIATNKNTVNGVDQFFSLQATIDTIPPVITEVATSSIQSTSATVTWITDKPSTAQVAYGTTTSLGSFTASSTTYDSQHIVMLNELSQSTKYYFRVVSIDQSGNIASSSQDVSANPYSFTTITPNSLGVASPTNITTTGATINWTSLAPSDSKVYYVATSTYPGIDKLLYKNSIGTPAATTSHSVILSGLAPGTQYYFLTESIDAAGTTVQNVNASSTFTTAYAPAPSISNVATSSIQLTGATISWNTDNPSTSQIAYGTTTSLGSFTATTTTYDSGHIVTLNSLFPGTTYYFSVISVDQAGNMASSSDIGGNPYTFTTVAQNSLGVASTNITTTSATINWTSALPSDSTVYYTATTTYPGQSKASYSSSVGNPTLATSHSIVLASLTPNTTYYFLTTSVDTNGNTVQNATSTETFTTNPGPVITPSSVTSQAGYSTSTISWLTNISSDSAVIYAESSTFANQQISYSSASTTSHTVTLAGLTQNTTYYFYVKSVDNQNNVAIDNNVASGTARYYTFTTAYAPAPSISNVATSSIQLTGATISWNTDNPSTSQIAYGTTTSLGSFTATTTTYDSGHIVTLNSLFPGTTYYFSVISVDQAGNMASSSVYDFTTLAVDRTPPTISSVATSTVGVFGATITWTTDKPSVSQIEYGTTADLGSFTATTTISTTQQVVVVGGLASSTTYYFRVISTDQSGNAASSSLDTNGNPYTFVTVPQVVINTIDTGGGGGGGGTMDNRDLTAPVISNIVVSDITKSSAVITFKTSKVSNGFVQYGLASNYGKEVGQAGVFGLSERVVVGGLEPNTKYYFRAKASDIYSNVGFSDGSSFTTNDLIDTNVVEASSTDNPAVVAQNVFAQKALSDFNKMLNSFASDPNLSSISEADIEASLSSFASKVISAPVISGTDITVDVGADSATIRWTTDKEANSMLAYAADSEYDAQKADPYTISAGFPDDSKTVHEVKLQNLAPTTTYHFQTRSQGRLGPVAVSKDITFTTTSLLPSIDNARFGNINQNNAVLSWRTDVPTKSTIVVKNSSTGEIQNFEDPNFTQDHNFTLDNLKISTGYTARIISTDANQNTSSPFIIPFYTEISKNAAKISNVKITTTLIPDQTSSVQTIISWKTDKPSTSKVWFGEGSGKDLTQSTSPDLGLVTDHTVITTLLSPGMVYKIVAESDDSAGNISKSNVYTALTPKQQGSIIDVIFQNFDKTFGFLKK